MEERHLYSIRALKLKALYSVFKVNKERKTAFFAV